MGMMPMEKWKSPAKAAELSHFSTGTTDIFLRDRKRNAQSATPSAYGLRAGGLRTNHVGLHLIPIKNCPKHRSRRFLHISPLIL
jgi:hypothetical protein